MHYKLSLIIPTYNNAIYLKELINELLKNEKNYSYELIIIDDGSTDNTNNILSNFNGDNIQILHLNDNHGVSYARNIGINNSKGEYITFLDSDDKLDSKYFDVIFNVIDLNYDCYIYGTRMVYEDHQSDYLSKLNGKYTKKEFIKEKDYLNIYFINWVTNKIFKKSIINNIKFDEKYKSGEDLKYITEVFKNIDSYYFINNILYYYNRTNDNSLTRNKKIDIVDTSHNNILNVYKMIINNNLSIEYFNEYKNNMFNYINSKIVGIDDSEEKLNILIEKNKLLNGSDFNEQY